MFSISSKEWKFRGFEDGYSIFISHRDGTTLKVDKVKYFNPRINGAVIIQNGKVDLTPKTKREEPELNLSKILMEA